MLSLRQSHNYELTNHNINSSSFKSKKAVLQIIFFKLLSEEEEH
jgi:hypothetical protein